MVWSQNYAPLGGLAISALAAATPIAALLGLLGFWKMRAQYAALSGLAVALLVADFAYGMPTGLAGAAAGYGAAFGLFPIGWIVVNAIFIYHLSVETGQFEALQRQLAGVSRDRRIQALLIAFCFGAFIEGAAGFGAPVAISGALMIGLGFRPVEAAKLALIGNTAPVAFGALGTPLVTLAKITELNLGDLSAMVGRQLPLFSLIIPFWLIAVQDGWRGIAEVWPACVVAGASFAFTQALVSNLHGPWLVDTASSLVSMGALALLMRVWKPQGAGAHEASREKPVRQSSGIAPPWKAWLPWAFLTVFVFLWGMPAIKTRLDALYSPSLPIPGLHKAVLRVPPVVPTPEPEPAMFNFNLLSATGTALLLAGVAGGLSLGLGPRGLAKLYFRTVWRLRVSLITIALMLALGFTTRYCGSDTTLGLVIARTGDWFPLFSPIIGWLGVALTGSDTSSNVLFGNLQKVTAQQLHFPPVLMAAANSSGGVMGKMIDAQSIVVAAVATGGRQDSPSAGSVLRAVFWHSLILALLVGCLVAAQAYWLPSLVPASGR